MRHSKLTWVGLLFVWALLSGCQLWNPGGGTYVDKAGRFQMDTPAGWQYATRLGPDLVASKEGPVLQQISVEHRELKRALPNSKKPLAEGIGAFELAEALIGDLRTDRSIAAFELTENAPAAIGGRDGCKLTFTFHTPDQLRLSETVYGCIADGQLWLIRYRAPVRHYFHRDLDTFEQMVKTFRFAKGAVGATG